MSLCDQNIFLAGRDINIGAAICSKKDIRVWALITEQHIAIESRLLICYSPMLNARLFNSVSSAFAWTRLTTITQGLLKSLMPNYEPTQKGHLVETYKGDPIYPRKSTHLSESCGKTANILLQWKLSGLSKDGEYIWQIYHGVAKYAIPCLILDIWSWRRITVRGRRRPVTRMGAHGVSQSGYVGVNRLWEFECWLQLSSTHTQLTAQNTTAHTAASHCLDLD